jgi:hypothetical protein
MATKRWHVLAIGLATAALTVAPVATGTAAAATGTNTVETSGTWAGYQASGSSSASVSANWIVPSPNCSSYGAVNFYVGIGGTPLTGAIITCVDGIASGQPWVAGSLLNKTLVPGDSVSASATYEGANVLAGETFSNYLIALTDHTQDWTYSLTVGYSSNLGDSAQVGVEPDNLECSPYSIDFCFTQWDSEPLVNFGTVHFTGTTFSGNPFGDATTDQINLVSGSTTEASTSSLDSSGEDFSITYQS